jgi:hypothetical protein
LQHLHVRSDLLVAAMSIWGKLLKVDSKGRPTAIASAMAEEARKVKAFILMVGVRSYYFVMVAGHTDIKC